LEDFANQGEKIPGQFWDAVDIPEAEFFRGEASDSAMPLTWAHAKRIKLRRSPRDGRVFGLPPQPVQRYPVEKTVPP
jgi:glucoamylase